MPKGEPNKQTLATAKYQQKAGYKSKSYKLKGDIADRFALACKATGRSQAEVITELIEKYIKGIDNTTN